jgi:hypothetical protein
MAKAKPRKPSVRVVARALDEIRESFLFTAHPHIGCELLDTRSIVGPTSGPVSSDPNLRQKKRRVVQAVWQIRNVGPRVR